MRKPGFFATYKSEILLVVIGLLFLGGIWGYKFLPLGLLNKGAEETADDRGGEVRQNKAAVCEAEIQALCPEAKERHDTVVCLLPQLSKVSSECLANFDICGPDWVKQCPGISSMKELRECMLSRVEQLSPGCEEEHYPCQKAKKRFCPTWPAHSEWRCLKEHESQLTKACQVSIKRYTELPCLESRVEFCNDSSDSKLPECLAPHRAKLPPACLERLKSKRPDLFQ